MCQCRGEVDEALEEEQIELSAQLRSDSDESFLSALTELLLHELHRLQGCTVEIHPVTSESDKKSPDFLITHKSGNSYLEARLATGQSEKECTADMRANVALDVINAIDVGNKRRLSMWLRLSWTRRLQLPDPLPAGSAPGILARIVRWT